MTDGAYVELFTTKTFIILLLRHSIDHKLITLKRSFEIVLLQDNPVTPMNVLIASLKFKKTFKITFCLDSKHLHTVNFGCYYKLKV